MKISIVFLVVLATAAAAPQNRQTYAVENIGGPNFKVSKTNSGFSIENYGGSAIDSSKTSAGTFEEHRSLGLNTDDRVISGSHVTAGSAYQSSAAAVGHSNAASQSVSSGVQNFAVTSHRSPNFNNERILIVSPGSLSSTLTKVQPESSFTSRVGNTQSNVFSTVKHTSNVPYGNSVVVSSLNPIAPTFQSTQSSRYTLGGSSNTSPSLVGAFGSPSTSGYYGVKSSGSLSSLENGSQLSSAISNYGNSFQKSGTSSSHISGSSSRVSDSFNSQFANKGSSSGDYSSGTGQFDGFYGIKNSGSVSGSGNRYYGASVQTNAATSGQKSVSSSGASSSLNSGFQHLHRTSGSSDGFQSGGYSNEIYRGQPQINQDLNSNYGRQQYASDSKSAISHITINPVVNKIHESLSGSNAHRFNDVAKSTQSTFSTSQYGLKLGDKKQTEKSHSNFGEIRLDHSGDSSSNAERGLTGNAHWTKSGTQSDSVGSSVGGSFSKLQSGSNHQTSYNAADKETSVVEEGASLQNSYILKQTQDQADDGSQFSYSYDSDNGISVQSSGSVKNFGTKKESQVMTGSYTYLGDDGQTYTVTYVADENGFQPQGVHLHPIPEEIIKSIEYNAAHPEEITLL